MIGLLVFVLVLGVVAYVVHALPIPAPFKNIAFVVLGVVLIVYLLGLLGGWGPWAGPVVVVR